ncbi:uncharacterized protein LOC122802008 [Protopterus annectens]|uniref:uncharacterized protein LOC122802008 n=1 Tax=Protopterus annectens TaxID=7888 RepID=UPI001CFA0AC5|nr:uncharacterized protein LOC122802008 [Protopterus annectens]
MSVHINSKQTKGSHLSHGVLNVLEGQSVLLETRQINKEAQEVIWKFQGHNLSLVIALLTINKSDRSYGNIFFYYRNRSVIYQNGSLFLHGVSPNDTGYYICTVTNINGDQNSVSTLLLVGDFSRSVTESAAVYLVSSVKSSSNTTQTENAFKILNSAGIIGLAVGVVLVLTAVTGLGILCYKMKTKNKNEMSQQIYSNDICVTKRVGKKSPDCFKHTTGTKIKNPLRNNYRLNYA